MDGFIILLILVPIVLFLIILNRTGEQRKLLESLYDKIKQLNSEVSTLTKEIKKQQPDTSLKPEVKEQAAKTPGPVTILVQPVQEKKEEQKKPVVIVSEPFEQESPGLTIINKPREEIRPIIPSLREQKERTQKRNTDIEKFIGENLANKIGIAVLVLGIAFFVKYAIDKNWIRESGRIIIGLISGSILIGLAHTIRNSYRSFSSVLVGGGLSVFYFTIAFAFHQYNLISQTAAFIIMVIISALGVVLSLFYNRKELAILATIGGFITPFLVSTGHENYIALFTYLCILNTGLMVLAWFKRWPAINIIALFFTTIIYGGWLIKRTVFDDSSGFPYKDAFLFATLFYILFVVMNIINSIRLKNKFTSFDFIIVLSTNFLYYAAGIGILGYYSRGDYEGLFTASLGIVNLLLAVIFYRENNVDRNFVSLLIGLALTFISLAVPVQFKANHVVLFWAAEAIVLYWLFLRTKIVLLRWGSFVLTILLLLSLILNWVNVYVNVNNPVHILINKGFITGIVSSVALFILYGLMRKEMNDPSDNKASILSLRNKILSAAIVTAYLSGALEILYQFSTHYPQVPVHIIYLQAYSFAVVIILLQVFKKDPGLPLMKFLLTVTCFVFYLFSLRAIYQVSLSLLSAGNGTLYIAHWVAAILLLWLLYDLIVFFFRKSGGSWLSYRSSFTWIAAAGMVLLLSVEMYHVIIWTNYHHADDWAWWENLYYKAGLSILWGLCSFVMMWLGMGRNFQTLRLISLTLFTITLVKLFLYDIRNIPPGGKIAAFILLGILLLAVSFMYQRLKKILIDNEAG
jgi:uncharacterized membrane protein